MTTYVPNKIVVFNQSYINEWGLERIYGKHGQFVVDQATIFQNGKTVYLTTNLIVLRVCQPI